jgi:hypothetical protein
MTDSMEQGPSWEANIHSARQEIPAFVGSEVSLLCSQGPYVGPCPEPDESSSFLLALFP